MGSTLIEFSALAEDWEESPHAARSTYHDPLDSISLFLLLDLLGAKNPKIPSYFKTTHWAYRAVGKLEQRLRKLGQFKSSPNHPNKRTPKDPTGPLRPRQEPRFLLESDNPDTTTRGFVEDDHIPFMARGVEILHFIPSPFPSVWHTMDDDGEHLDIDTVEDWAKLVTAFAAEWMDLEGFMGKQEAAKRAAPEEQANAASDRKKRKAAQASTDKQEL